MEDWFRDRRIENSSGDIFEFRASLVANYWQWTYTAGCFRWRRPCSNHSWPSKVQIIFSGYLERTSCIGCGSGFQPRSFYFAAGSRSHPGFYG